MPRFILHLCTAPERRALWRALLAALVVVITWLALIPAPPKAITTGWDKSNHALAFASLAFASAWAVWPRVRRWPLLFVVVLAYGGAIEIAQSYLPPREGDWLDLLADAVGISLGLLLAWPVAVGAAGRADAEKVP
jgi:VanZ family protein